MHPEIEKFINLTLVDGILTDQERKIIFKKAQENGFDLEELEIILAAKLYEKQQSINTKPKSEKLGDLKKCPACGSEVQSFQINCVACNHEFNNIDANVSI